MATTKKANTASKKSEVIVNTTTKKATSGVTTAKVTVAPIKNIKAVDESARKTVILKKESVKVEPKKAEVKKAAEPKKATATKTTTKAAATKKTTEKKATATKKTTTAKKTTTTTKKAAPKKEEMKVSLHVQYGGKSLEEQYITDRVIENYVAAGNKKSSIKTLETYVKIEDNTVYYVVNSTFRGHVVLN